jgi:hypothetical protein
VRGPIVALFVELARDDVPGLVVLVTLVVVIALGRLLFQRRSADSARATPSAGPPGQTS